MAKQSLVIVESPAKAKTIEKYLGKEFRVKASMPPLDHRVKGKRDKNTEISSRSLEIVESMREEALR